MTVVRGTGAWAAALALALAACGAEAGAGDDGLVPDARRDAAGPADAARPDAAPCVAGDAHAVDPDSGTCFTAHLTTRVPWAAARAACQAMGADLATIDSAVTNALLTALIGANEAFVGGSDQLAEGQFVWVSGAAVTFTNWRQNPPPATNEPNNGNGVYQEDCIVLQGQLGGVWDDRPCDSTEVAPPAGTHYYVCAR